MAVLIDEFAIGGDLVAYEEVKGSSGLDARFHGQHLTLVFDILLDPGEANHAGVEAVAKLGSPSGSTVDVQRAKSTNDIFGEASQGVWNFIRRRYPSPLLQGPCAILASPDGGPTCLHRTTLLADSPGFFLHESSMCSAFSVSCAAGNPISLSATSLRRHPGQDPTFSIEPRRPNGAGLSFCFARLFAKGSSFRLPNLSPTLLFRSYSLELRGRVAPPSD